MNPEEIRAEAAQLVPVQLNYWRREGKGRRGDAEVLLTPDMLKTIGGLLAEGQYVNTVAAYLGISKQVWWNWEQRGERDKQAGHASIHAQFLDLVKRAEALGEILLVREVRQGYRGWESKAWIAERRFPERWGRRQEITIRREAERLAAETGCTVEEIIAEAERLAQSSLG